MEYDLFKGEVLKLIWFIALIFLSIFLIAGAFDVSYSRIIYGSIISKYTVFYGEKWIALACDYRSTKCSIIM